MVYVKRPPVSTAKDAWEYARKNKDRKAEKEAQERYNVPIDKAGRDYIARPYKISKYEEGWERIFGKKKKSAKK